MSSTVVIMREWLLCVVYLHRPAWVHIVHMYGKIHVDIECIYSSYIDSHSLFHHVPLLRYIQYLGQNFVCQPPVGWSLWDWKNEWNLVVFVPPLIVFKDKEVG